MLKLMLIETLFTADSMDLLQTYILIFSGCNFNLDLDLWLWVGFSSKGIFSFIILTQSKLEIELAKWFQSWSILPRNLMYNPDYHFITLLNWFWSLIFGGTYLNEDSKYSLRYLKVISLFGNLIYISSVACRVDSFSCKYEWLNSLRGIFLENV